MTAPVWKVCPFNERYEVSDHGFVRNFKTKRVLKPYLVDGYFRLSLNLGSKRKHKQYLVNRLVLLTFEGPSNDTTKNQAAHVNGNRIDNRLTNLKWKDHAGNHEDRVKHGTVLNGEAHPRARLTKEKVFLPSIKQNIMRSRWLSSQHQCAVETWQTNLRQL